MIFLIIFVRQETHEDILFMEAYLKDPHDDHVPELAIQWGGRHHHIQQKGFLEGDNQ